MKFKDLSLEQQYKIYQAYEKGEIKSPADVDKFFPKEAPKGLQTIDETLSGAAKGVSSAIETAKKNPIAANRIQRWGDLLKLGAAPLGAVDAGINWAADTLGIPKGPSLEEALPKTVEATGMNPNVRDLGTLLAFEGLGRAGSMLKGYGDRGAIKAFEAGKPKMPSTANKDMVDQILAKNYLPAQEAATDAITSATLGLKEKGMGARDVAKGVSDSSPLNITPSRIEQLHEFFPEHPVVKDLKARLDAARAGEITKDFIETKPGYTRTDKVQRPSEVIQSTAEQPDLFDQDYYANPDAYSKQIPDFVNHPERGTFPPSPEIQKPIEPELMGNATKIPAEFSVEQVQVPPEGRYEFYPESVYDLFSYANKNRHKAWQRDPITGQPMAKNVGFGEMMQGLRSDLRSVQTQLSPEQLARVKEAIPGFQGASIGDAVTALNAETTGSIKDQKYLSLPNVGRNPLTFAESVYKQPDQRAFAQRLARDSDLDALLKFGDEYGSSREYAKDLQKYLDEGLKKEGIVDIDHLATKALWGGLPNALAHETGVIIGNPAKRHRAASALGGFAEKLKPSNLLNMGE